MKFFLKLLVVIYAIVFPFLCSGDSLKAFQEKLENTERPLSAEEKAELLERYKRASELTKDIPEEFTILSNAISVYNRTREKEQWAIVRQELDNEQSQYHGTIFSKIRIAEPEVAEYLVYARQAKSYDERVALAISLRRAPPTDEVFQFLESMIAERENDGLISEYADYSLRELQGRRVEDTLMHKRAERGMTSNETPFEEVNVERARDPISEDGLTQGTDLSEPNDRGGNVSTSAGSNHYWLWLMGAALAIGAVLFKCRPRSRT